MKEQYQQEIEKIHAPQELINRTLQRINQEEKNKKVKRKKIIIKSSIPAILAAMILITIKIQPENEFIYNEIPNMSFVSQKQNFFWETGKEKISVKEYMEYIKIDIDEFMEQCDLKKEKIEVVYDDDRVVNDEGVFSYQYGKSKVIVRLSKNKELIPEDMQELKISEINGRDVWVVSNEKHYRHRKWRECIILYKSK